MEIFQIDAAGQLFIAPDIDDWQPVAERGITAVFDLDEGPDHGIPVKPNQFLYIHFPFEDKELPDLRRLHEVAQLGAGLVTAGGKVLVHCAMGHNRSALLAGLILTYLGMSGIDAVTLLRQQRRGALYNRRYAHYLQSLPSMGMATIGATPIDVVPTGSDTSHPAGVNANLLISSAVSA